MFPLQELIEDRKLFGISFPYTRIPNLFTHGSSMSTISIELFQENNSSKMEGRIALFIVFAIKEDKKNDKDSEAKTIYCNFLVDECHLENPIIDL